MSNELGKLAITLPTAHLSSRECLEIARRAEDDWGYDAIWLAETNGPDSFGLSAAIAVATSRITIGSAIVPVYNRSPAILAMSAATISDLSEGRFVLGLGSSSHAIVEDWNGIPFSRPLTHVRDCVAICRQAFTGDRTNYQGEVLHSHGFRLSRELRDPVPIYIAALREKMLMLAGEIGDGLIVNLFPRAALAKILAAYRSGSSNENKNPFQTEVICRHQLAITQDIPGMRDLVRTTFGAYFATPVYNRFLAWCGYPEEMSRVAKAFQCKDREGVKRALHDGFVDEIAILGDLDTCRQRLASYVEGGITTTVLSPIATNFQTTIELYEALAPAYQ